jgi:hypothetical protein
MTEDSSRDTFDLDGFKNKLRSHLDKEYPTAKRIAKKVQPQEQQKMVEKKVAPPKVMKTPQELQEEAGKVDGLMKAAPAMPEKEGEVYHVVAISWWTQWKAYTGYGTDTPMSTEAREHPGPMNTEKQLEALCEQEAWLKHPKDNVQIKTSCKEDEDFVLLPDSVWTYLFETYGGTDIPRYSISLASDAPSDDIDFQVEVYYQKLQLYILPKNTSHLVLKRPSAVYISRKATVKQYHEKVAEILLTNSKDFSLEQLLSMSRIWRLDTGESVLEIEKDFNYENSKNLPMQVRGRILDESLAIENINVATNDVLMYEVVLSTVKGN